MATVLTYFTYPEYANGVLPQSSNSSWIFGGWVSLNASLSEDIYIAAITYQQENIPVVDTTIEQLFEIGVGETGTEVTKIQIPTSFRADTNANIYMSEPLTVFLPEPYFAPIGVRLSVRVANSDAQTNTYPFKIIYQSTEKIIPLAYSNNFQFAHSVSQGVISVTNAIK